MLILSKGTLTSSYFFRRWPEPRHAGSRLGVGVGGAEACEQDRVDPALVAAHTYVSAVVARATWPAIGFFHHLTLRDHCWER